MTNRIRDFIPQPKPRPSDQIVIENVGTEQSMITLKPSGFTASTAGLIFFALFWNGFLVVWTGFALMASLFFALFSIPFWLVGITMVIGIFTSLFGSQEILIRHRNLIVRKYTIFGKSEHIIEYNTLNSIELEKFTKFNNRSKNSFKMIASGQNDSGISSKTPTISYSNQQLFVGEHLSENDKIWLVDYLNEKIIPLLRFISVDERDSEADWENRKDRARE